MCNLIHVIRVTLFMLYVSWFYENSISWYRQRVNVDTEFQSDASTITGNYSK